MITAIIAEDESPQREGLRALLREVWPELEIVAECEDGLSALEAFQTHRPQVAFLDIRMPGLSGLEVAKSAAGTQVIFTTAYNEYAIEAFERGAVDYLLKPINRERLVLSIQRVRERVQRQETVDLNAVIDSLSRMTRTPREDRVRWITASAGHTTKMFAIEDVVYFRAQEKYTHVVTRQDEGDIRTSLKELVSMLDSDEFWQIHRSIIVRANAIRALRKDDDGRCWVQLKESAAELPVSSAFQHRFKAM